MPIQTGWIVGPTSIAEFRIHPISYGPDIPRSTVQSSLLNAELIFRGSQIRTVWPSPSPTGPSRLSSPPTSTLTSEPLWHRLHPSGQPRARGLWSSLIGNGEEQTAAQFAEVLAHSQIPELRDRLSAVVPGLDLPMEMLLFGESDTAPDWDRG